mgnify:CR=1 FL=1
MGKKRREQVQENQGKSKWLSPREKIRQFKAAFGDWTDDQEEKIAMQARMKFAPRWMEECGVTDIKDIDMNNPQISLEWKLCHPAILRDLKNETKRNEFLKTLTPEELDVYMNKVDEKGASYRDLEGKSGFTKKNIAKAVVKYKKTQT